MTVLPEPRFVDTDGARLAVFEAKPERRERDVCVVLCHGFPELAASWRHQLQPIADAGFHVMAPDMRGYGLSDGPDDPRAYSIRENTADVAALIADAGYEKAVVVGHDFGGMVSWNMPYLQPDSVAGVITLNTPFGYSRENPIEKYLEAYGPRNYVAHFQTQECEEQLDKDPERTFRFFMRRDTGSGTNLSRTGRHDPDSMAYIHWLQDDESTWPGEVIMDDTELRYYSDAYARKGFKGGLNWYRSIERNWEVHTERFPDGAVPRAGVPALMIAAQRDPICHPMLSDNLLQYFDDFERRMIDTGHWTQLEDPEGTTAILVDWLTRHFA
ncbi:alpha/beta fold hydrolase [Rhodococcus sp. NPDC127528]|uniref:alpha/beta fold hydrolase n=1 Tax=unclassified Rhodococcus (in: high G+C Gram-positive bacteria) TaxID=192944 RepID=UPI003642E0CB